MCLGALLFKPPFTKPEGIDRESGQHVAELNPRKASITSPSQPGDPRFASYRPFNSGTRVVCSLEPCRRFALARGLQCFKLMLWANRQGSTRIALR